MTGIPTGEFDGYRPIRRLGQGGMGEVHLALDTLLDRHVAIKFITSGAHDPLARTRFMMEARAFARLQHPNVVSIYRVGETGGIPYLVSEYVQGKALDYPGLAPMSADQIIQVASGIARGLAAAHQRGVIHRDIKPANVMLTDDGEAKLLDFGIAKILEQMVDSRRIPLQDSVMPVDAAPTREEVLSAEQMDALERHSEAPHPRFSASQGRDLTRPGTAVGTPRYMAPEIWRGQSASFRSDVYSFGGLLFYLATGHAPFEGTSAREIGKAIVSRDAPSLLHVSRGIPAALALIVEKCLQRDPAHRYANGNDLRAALAQLTPEMRRASSHSGNPYRGLSTFEAEHAELFFGRDSETRLIMDRLKTESMVVVVGDSGVGKSSLCRAGILPRVNSWLGGDREWQIVTLIPGRHPIISLSIALSSVIGLSEQAVESMLREEPSNIPRLLRAAQGQHRGTILFIDQLEELITISDPTEVPTISELLQWLAIDTPGIRVLATVRGDFLSQLATHPGMTDQISRTLFFLRPLSAERVEEAIVGPARSSGVEFESTDLVAELVSSTVKSKGGLPLLQFALCELWEARDRQNRIISWGSLRTIGGVSGALARHADSVVQQMVLRARLACREVLIRLVTAEHTRARLTIAELNPNQSSDIQEAINALIRGRLIVAEESPTGASCEIAHEALITAWPLLESWLTEDADARAIQERLRSAVDEWLRLNQSPVALWSRIQLEDLRNLDADSLDQDATKFIRQSRRRIRLRRLLITAAIVVLPLIGLSIYTGARIQNQAEQDRRVNRAMADALEILKVNRTARTHSQKVRQKSLMLFETRKLQAAEVVWDEYLALHEWVDKEAARAAGLLETAMMIDHSRTDVQSKFADILLGRALLSREAGDMKKAEELIERLELYDDGSRLRQWNSPGEVEVVAGVYEGPWRIEQVVLSKDSLKYERVPRPGEFTGNGRLSLPPGSWRIVMPTSSGKPAGIPVRVVSSRRSTVELMPRVARTIPPGMIRIPAGPFLFGSASDNQQRRDFYHAAPLHERVTDAYLIAVNETTFREWLQYLDSLSEDERAARTPRVEKGGFQGALTMTRSPEGIWQLRFQPSSEPYSAAAGEQIVYPGRQIRREQDWLRIPVVGITAADAEAYTRWLSASGSLRGARLCTELEWEKAARGVDGREFPHGEQLNRDDANFDNTYLKNPQAMGPDEVGSYPASASPFGLNDLAGNAWEWTVSVLELGYVARGGSWYYGPNTSRTTERAVTEASFRDTSVGLRVCADWE